MKKKRKKKQNTPKELSWAVVESYLKEETKAGAAMALIETEKILNHILERLQYEGKTVDQKLRSAKKDITNYQDLKTARSVTKKIRESLYTQITPPEAREIMKPYLESIRILAKSKRNNSSFLARVSFKVQDTLPSIKGILKYSIIGFFVFFLAVYLIDTTEFGNTVAQAAVSISHAIFSWVLFTILLVTGATIIGVSTIFYFEKQRKKNSLSLTQEIETDTDESEIEPQDVKKKKKK